MRCRIRAFVALSWAETNQSSAGGDAQWIHDLGITGIGLQQWMRR
jgi:hypothetical protein